jgi:hypothetical protein
MRTAFIILIALHGIIHLFGFLKAFNLAEFNAITQPITKPLGIIWLAAFVIFLATLILFWTQYDYWWIMGIIGVILSQFLIIVYWQDAKFGTILNVVILAGIIVVYSDWSFARKVQDETAQMLANSSISQQSVVSESMISGLPGIVQQWLISSGVIGKERIQNVYLEQEAQMAMKPEQQKWINARAEQYFTVEPPAFNWSVKLKTNPWINLVGRDKFERGKGEMTIKLLSVFPVVNANGNDKVDQATLQRYLAEIVWFPSAALSPYITWEALSDYSAQATMTYNGTQGSGVFHFDEKGVFQKFVTMRYKDSSDAEPTQWTVTATKTEERNGIKIPVECKAAWKLDNGDWTWLKLTVKDIEYNVPKLLGS